MKKIKYSVLTFIFGNYEKLHDILDVQPDTEYICITDNKNLKSSTWKIIYDEINPNYTPFRKVIEVRYNPFKYVNTDICLIIDGSIQLLKMPYNLLNYFNDNNFDLCTFTHPERNNLIVELNTWKKYRNLSDIDYNACKTFLNNINYDEKYLGLYQVNLLLVKNNKQYNSFRKKCLSIINTCAINNSTFRVDQILFSAILHKYFKNKINFLPLSEKELRGEYLRSYCHNSDLCQLYKKIDLEKKDYKYSFNEIIESKYIDNLKTTKDKKDITVAICNFNTTELTNACIKSFLKFNSNLFFKFIILDNSDKQKFKLHDDIQLLKNITIIDNTNGKYINFKNIIYTFGSNYSFNNYANLKHTYSIQYLLNICTTDIFILMDSDVLLKKSINNIINIIDNYICIGHIEKENINFKTKDLMYKRIYPFFHIFNMKKIRKMNIKYFDSNRIWFGKNMICNHYDTGASFYEDIQHYNNIYEINIFDYIVHFGGASEYQRNEKHFLDKYTYLYT